LAGKAEALEARVKNPREPNEPLMCEILIEILKVQTQILETIRGARGDHK